MANNKTVQIELSPKDTNQGESTKYLWAQAQLQTMLAFPHRYEQEITQMGTQLSIPTPFTSLIVLEDSWDYVRYGITPPESLLGAFE